MQQKVIDVRFENAGKAYSFLVGDLFLNVGDKVLVETVRGVEIGSVIKPQHVVEVADMYDGEIKSVVRIATNEDLKKVDDLLVRAKKIKKETIKIVEKHKLDMKIVNVDICFDESKVTINFTSENRVDFRELVKELGSIFKTRIELRQIGARDEVKKIGGLGPCGKVCCCKEFLVDFEHVSIKMPKVQGLSLNPAKISGLCGRLMCCLAYENKHYSETFRQMPRINSEVETPKGKGTVVYNNLLKRIVQVRIGEKGNAATEFVEFPLEEIKILSLNSVGIDDDPNSSRLSELE
ncbi:MAG: regulatory iron-sulfur-containing complex subunit RicT [Clostridia bacterium]